MPSMTAEWMSDYEISTRAPKIGRTGGVGQKMRSRTRKAQIAVPTRPLPTVRSAGRLLATFLRTGRSIARLDQQRLGGRRHQDEQTIIDRLADLRHVRPGEGLDQLRHSRAVPDNEHRPAGPL